MLIPSGTGEGSFTKLCRLGCAVRAGRAAALFDCVLLSFPGATPVDVSRSMGLGGGVEVEEMSAREVEMRPDEVTPITTTRGKRDTAACTRLPCPRWLSLFTRRPVKRPVLMLEV
jgi:hypothetical protein